MIRDDFGAPAAKLFSALAMAARFASERSTICSTVCCWILSWDTIFGTSNNCSAICGTGASGPC